MIIEEIKNIKSGRSELRKFGITMGIFLGLLGGLSWWRANDYYSYLFILSIAFLLFGLAMPMLLKPIHKIWMTLAILMGWLMTRIILSVLFYLVVTPVSLLTRLFGKDFLGLRFNNDADSYWIPREGVKKHKSEYEKQF